MLQQAFVDSDPRLFPDLAESSPPVSVLPAVARPRRSSSTLVVDAWEDDDDDDDELDEELDKELAYDEDDD